MEKRLPAVNLNIDQTKEFKNDWYSQPKEEMFQHVFGLVSQIENNQDYRKQDFLRYLKLYNNQNILGLNRKDYAKTSPVKTGRLKLNVVRSVVDTISSKIAAQKPRCTFLTTEGDFGAKSRAKKLQQYMDGLMQSIKAYPIMQEVFQDACVFGIGAAFVGISENKPYMERVFVPDEILVHDIDGIYGNPSQLFRVLPISKAKLLSLYPEHKEAILSANADSNRTDDSSVNLGEGSDMVKTIVAWKLPSSKSSEDGVYTVCIHNTTLESVPYKKQYFPFIFFRWSNNRLGFYGRGIPEELMEIQLEINKILKTIQESNELVIKPKVFVEQGSMLDTTAINNMVGAIIKYSGTKPDFYTPSAIPPEYYQFLGQLIERAYQISGISALAATQAKPAGLNSAVALREYKDTTSERFQLTVQRYEDAFIDLAEQLIDLTEELAEDEENDVSVKSGGEKTFVKLDWKQIKMDKEDYILRRYPTALLPTEPAAKLQTVMDWFSTGFITKDQAMSFLDFPDTEDMKSLVTAPLEVVKMRVEMMLEHGDYLPPDQYLDLNLAIKYTNLELHRGILDGVKESRLDLLRQFIDECANLLNPPPPPPPPMSDMQAAQPPMPPAGMPPGPPPPEGIPMPPPPIAGPPMPLPPPPPMQ